MVVKSQRNNKQDEAGKGIFINENEREENTMKIGFIGLGIMGKPMAKNLVKAGHELVVFDLNKEAVAELVACGATSAKSSKEVAAQVEVVITMVPNSPHVRAAVLGKDGVAEGAKPGLVLIDMSSIDPTESKKIGEECMKYGIEMLDAPVSGGEPKAIDGTLSVMVGGKKDLFDKYYDMLMVMAGSVVYVGDLGSGNVAKLANQMIVAINIAAVSEALIFAKKAGTDPELVYQAIRGGLAGSTVMDAKALADKGKNAEEIKDILEAHKMDSSIYITLETLKYLKKGGRITPAAAAIGTMLKLNPVLQIQGEKLDAFAKARGKSSAKKIMLKAMKDDCDNRFKDYAQQGKLHMEVAYTGNEEEAREWAEAVKEAFPQYDFHMDPLSLSVACHIGYGSLAIAVSAYVPEAE